MFTIAALFIFKSSMLQIHIEQPSIDKLVIYDKGNIYINNPNNIISDWILNIYGSKLSKTYTFDICTYLRTNSIVGEILTLTPQNFDELSSFKDGVYYYTSLINGIDTFTDSFLILSTIDKQLEDIAIRTTPFVSSDVIKQINYVLTPSITDNINKAIQIRTELVILLYKKDYQLINDKLDILQRLLAVILNFLTNVTNSNNK